MSSSSLPPGPILKSTDEIDAIARATRIASEVLAQLQRAASPGVTTAELDRQAAALIAARGSAPAFPGVKDLDEAPGFPGVICASVNDEVVHTPPNDRPLQAGDLLTLDLGLIHAGWFADTARSMVVPTAREQPAPSSEARWVAEGAHLVLNAGLRAVKAGIRWSVVARAMEAEAARLGLGIVTEFVGHGIGKHLHELPKAPAWWEPSEFEDFILEPGLVLAVEPIVTAQPGRTRTRLEADGWTVRTTDSTLAAHAEAMVAIDPATASPRILTQ